MLFGKPHFAYLVKCDFGKAQISYLAKYAISSKTTAKHLFYFFESMVYNLNNIF